MLTIAPNGDVSINLRATYEQLKPAVRHTSRIEPRIRRSDELRHSWVGRDLPVGQITCVARFEFDPAEDDHFAIVCIYNISE